MPKIKNGPKWLHQATSVQHTTEYMVLQQFQIYFSIDDRWFAKHCRISEFQLSRPSDI